MQARTVDSRDGCVCDFLASLREWRQNPVSDTHARDTDAASDRPTERSRSCVAAGGRDGADYRTLGLELVLVGLQSPINIGMILRIAETYQFQVSIFDAFGVLDDPTKLGTIDDFGCGAVARRGFRRIVDEAALAHVRGGRRLVATSIVSDAVGLSAHRFRPGDLIALGNEYDGLPEALLASADVVVRIPMPAAWTPKPKARNPIDPLRTAPVARDGSPNLNVAVTAGIICYAAYETWLDGRLAQPSAVAPSIPD
jgi:tRNA G18 (ribose-2'-O)-methylase SpoU